MEKMVYPMRINKYLAQTGHSTRRGADELITKGQVFINGRLAILGDKVNEGDKVELRFRGKQKPFTYIVYNKPRGILSHSAQENEKDIKQEIKEKNKNNPDKKLDVEKIFPVGRLDKDSHGLIILTDDGRITERLLGPSYFHEKEYLVKVKGALRPNFKTKMEAGVKIEKEETAKCKVEILSKNSFKIILTEGKKHQIRRMCVALFQEVEDLKRIRIMNIILGNLQEGDYRKIEGKELETFLGSLGLS